MTVSQQPPLLLACSPRQGGNCDAVMDVVRDTLRSLEPSVPQVTFLRNHTISPCVSCGHCALQRLGCPRAERDDSGPLFAAFCRAPALVLVAPIYFYHLPAQFKALIDRSQPWWMLRDVWSETPPSRKPAHAILLGARPQGERLFEGALLSLRYWLDLFGYDLAEPLTLYGLDGPDAFRGNAAHREQVARYAAGVGSALASRED